MREVDGIEYTKDESRADAKWRQSSADDQDSLDELSPHTLLSLLRRASVDSEHLGEDAVRGVRADKCRLSVDCEKAAFRDCRDEMVPAEFWIAEDDTVRRIQVAAGGYSATMEFFDFGAAVEISRRPPTKSRPRSTRMNRTAANPTAERRSERAGRSTRSAATASA